MLVSLFSCLCGNNGGCISVWPKQTVKEADNRKKEFLLARRILIFVSSYYRYRLTSFFASDSVLIKEKANLNILDLKSQRPFLLP